MTSVSSMSGRSLHCFEEVADVLTEGFTWPLPGVPEIPGVSWAHIVALEVANEDMPEITPGVDAACR